MQEAASLVAAQVELSVIDAQEERLAQAELRALRAQISPHFIYNALAAVAGEIHTQPEEARELLTDFAEFTRYLFRDGRPYVTLGEELGHVERYLRLEQARFRDRLHVTIDVEPRATSVVVPVMSVQPLVENAVRHGVERRAGTGLVQVTARIVRGRRRVAGHRRRLRDRAGANRRRSSRAPVRASGCRMSNARLRATFGERYALADRVALGAGTTAVMTVPNLQGERAGPAMSARRPHDPGGRRRADSARGSRPAAAQLPVRGGVECALDGHDALVKATAQQYDAIFLDVRMPDLDGLELARVLRRFASAPRSSCS